MSNTKKRMVIVTAVLGLVLAGLLGGWFWYKNTHIFVEDAVYAKDSTSLDLRGTGISVAHYDAVHQQLPECAITWELPFQGGFVDAAAEELTVTTLAEEEVALLDYLPRLKTVDATDCADYAQLVALQQRRPEVKVRYRLEILGQTVTESTTELSYDEKEPEAAELMEKLAWLPNMENIHFTEPEMAAEDLLALREAYPNVAFTWEKTVLDTVYPDDVAEIDISGTQLETVEDIEAAMAYFPDLEKLVMCKCGIDNETMAAFRDRAREDYKVVWSVYIHPLTVRTDDLYFMPGKYNETVVNYHLKDLIYCEDMLCVDLGHMMVLDCEWVKGMPNLKYLILADSPIVYIEPLETCKNLVYLELFMTEVQDLTPLQGCTALEDLSLAVTHCDCSPLAEMPWLKNLWVNRNSAMNPATQALLTESLPNTHIEFKHGWPTGGGWRELQNYFDMRDLLGMPYNHW